jgi:hypothetical protein
VPYSAGVRDHVTSSAPPRPAPVADAMAAAALIALCHGLTTNADMVEAPTGPCDIFAAGKTPCVAAHSTVRAMFGSYAGALYQVQRKDGATMDVKVVGVGGVADAKSQDAFCGASSCVIQRIFDQSSRANHLDIAPPGGAHRAKDAPCNATRESLTVGGHRVYSAYFEGGMGYRNDRTSGIATGDEPATTYAVFGGTHYNGGCWCDDTTDRTRTDHPKERTHAVPATSTPAHAPPLFVVSTTAMPRPTTPTTARRRWRPCTSAMRRAVSTTVVRSTQCEDRTDARTRLLHISTCVSLLVQVLARGRGSWRTWRTRFGELTGLCPTRRPSTTRSSPP